MLSFLKIKILFFLLTCLLASFDSVEKTAFISYYNKETIDEILLILGKARENPKELWPVKNIPKKNKINQPAVLELLKVLLKHVSVENKVAPKLIAKQIDLEIIASGEKNDLKLFQGWRYEIFGGLVENLIEGKIAIKIQNGKLLILKNN